MPDKKVKLDIELSAKDGYSAAFGRLSASVQKAAAGMRKLSAAASSLSMRSGLTSIGQSVANLGRAAQGIGQGAQQSFARLTSLTGKLTLALGGASGGMLALAKNTAANAEAVGLTAQSLGIATKDLQKFRYAASFSNISAEEMDGAFKKLGESARMAGEGNKELASLFEALGVQVKDSDGRLKSSSQLMMELATSFESMADGPEKTAIALKLFGKQGAALVPFLSQGQKAIRDLGKEAQELGIVFDDNESKLGADFDYALGKSQQALQGLANTIGVKLFPILTPLMETFAEWIKNNRQIVAAKVAEWAQAFADKLPAIMDGLREAVNWGGRIVDWADQFVDAIGGAKGVLAIFTAYISAPFVKGVAGAVSAFSKFSATLLATPAGWILGVVAAIAGAAYLIYQNWEGISEWFGSLWESVKQVFDGFGQFIKGVFTLDFTSAAEGLQKVWEGVKKFFSTYWSGIGKAFEAGLKAIGDLLGIDLVGPFKAGWDGLVGFFKGIWDSITDIFNGAFKVIDGVMKAVSGFLTKIFGDRDKAIAAEAETRQRAAMESDPSNYGAENYDSPQAVIAAATARRDSGFGQAAASRAATPQVTREEKVEKSEVRLILPEGVTAQGAERAQGVTVSRGGMGAAAAYVSG